MGKKFGFEQAKASDLGMIPRVDFVFLMSVTGGIGQEDPDAGGGPRIDLNDHEFVTNSGIKRRIRDVISTLLPDEDGYGIFVARDSVLERAIIQAAEEVSSSFKQAMDKKRARSKSGNGKEKNGKEKNGKGDSPKLTREEARKVRDLMCRRYFDVRAFGGVMSQSKSAEAGRILGPVQIFDAVSVDPTQSEVMSITRVAISDEERSEKASRDQDMGSRSRAPFTVYPVQGTVNPWQAKQTGFSKDDLDLLFKVIPMMFGSGPFGPSATRGLRTIHKIVIFEHESPYGNAQSETLYNLVKVTRKDPDAPASGIGDYDITVGDPPPRIKKIEIDPA